MLIACIGLAVAGPQSAYGSWEAVIDDCSEGDDVITGTYSHADYARALKELATDVDEYTPCRELIRAALLEQAGKRAAAAQPGNSGAAAQPPRPIGDDERRAVGEGLTELGRGDIKVLPLGGAVIDPLRGSHRLPPALIALLVVAGAVSVGAGAFAIYRRGRAQHP